MAHGDELYLLSDKDRSIVAATIKLLRKIVGLPAIHPEAIQVVAQVLNAFEKLPRRPNGLDVHIELSGPRRWYGEHEIWHWWNITVEESWLHVTSGGHFYRKTTGGDNFTCMDWSISPGEESDYTDFLDRLKIVDDAQPYEVEVSRLIPSEPGYTLHIMVDGESLPYYAIVVDSTAGIQCFLLNLEHLEAVAGTGTKRRFWRMSAQAIDTYKQDSQIQRFELQHQFSSWSDKLE